MLFDDISTTKTHQRLKIGHMVVLKLLKNVNSPDFTGGAHNIKEIIKGGLGKLVTIGCILFDDISTSKPHQRLKIGHMAVFELLKNMNGPDFTGGAQKIKEIIKGGLGMLVTIDWVC